MEINNFVANLTSPQKIGTDITLSVSTIGGIGTLQTQFAVFNGSRWELIKGYSTSQSALWTPNKSGTYRIDVNVKDESGAIETKTLIYVTENPYI